MRFDLRLPPALVLAGVMVLCVSGCTSEANATIAPQGRTSTSTPSSTPGALSSPTPSTAEAIPDDSAGMSAFERQLPLAGQFVSQGAETVGSVEIARRSDGTVWATLSNFRTGSSPNLRLYFNEGALVKNSDGAWTTDGGVRWDVAAFIEPAGTQEFVIPGSDQMPEIHSVTVFDYAGPDYLHFGSAPLG